MANKKSTQNWDDLRYFLAVVRAGTLSAASELLDTEHTTVARHIRALEDRLGARLFLKSNSGYTLTPSGERLQKLAEKIECGHLMAADVARNANAPIEGVVRIGSPDGLGSTFLIPRMRSLTQKHSKLCAEFITTTRTFSLSKREADIAIGFSRAEHARIVSRRLTDYNLYVYASEDYLAKRGRIESNRDFRRHDFIGYVEDFVYFSELDYLDEVDEEISPQITSTNLMAQVFATLAGGGLCILPSFIAACFPTLRSVVPDQVALKRTYFMHIHEDHRNATHVRAVADFISKEMEANDRVFLCPPDYKNKVQSPWWWSV